MLASRRSDRSPATSSDRDAGPAIALASSDSAAITAAVTTAIAHSVPAATSSGSCTTTTASPATAATLREHGSCRQSGNHQSEHEHAESCHVAPPP
jgi:hypothetical protein